MKLINFDEMFDKALARIVEKKIGNVKPEEIEASIPALYDSWLNMKNTALDGMSPIEFVDRLASEGLLGKYILSYAQNGMEICDIVAARVTEREIDDLIALFRDYPDYALVAVTMIGETGSTRADSELINYYLNGEDSDIKEVIGDVISHGHEGVVPALLMRMATTTEDERKRIIDVLYHYSNDKEIFGWLSRLFLIGDDIPLYAGYIGAYGDTDGIKLLKDYAAHNRMTHYEFLEIRNAVERLGGEMDGDYEVDG